MDSTHKLYIPIGAESIFLIIFDSNIKQILGFSVYSTINFLPPKDYSEKQMIKRFYVLNKTSWMQFYCIFREEKMKIIFQNFQANTMDCFFFNT